ncbi:MAG: hypothetical protein OXM55_02995 [Bdellovibrionales bacterium]|nr:hypothetical protein [Bdellovibrionales bacterium]
MYECSIKSSTRVDLAGGLLDIWPVYALVPDCFVLNFSIPVFTSVKLRYSSELQLSCEGGPPIDISVFSPSGSYKNSFTRLNDLLKDSSDELSLLKKHLEYWKGYFPREQIFLKSIYLRSESPIGGGLGASSSLCVGLAKVLSSVFKQELRKKELLMLCRDLETSLLHAPAGIQDYIPAIEEDPGFLYTIECMSSGPKWNRKKIPSDFFADHFLLVDTGKSHHSGNNNWEILKKIIEKDQDILNGIYQLRDNALKTVEICDQENWSDLFVYVNKEQELRGRYFSNWLNPSVSSLIGLMRSHGAKAAKLCGAGGGGCLLVLAENQKHKQELEQVCEKNKISIVMNW